MATLVAIAIAATTALAQFGTFDPAFGGELWVTRHQLVPAGNDLSLGVVFVDGTLYVVEPGIGSIVAYDSAGAVVDKTGAQWDTTAAGSPVFGMQFNRLAAAVVTVNGVDRKTILVSDYATNRAVAFDTAGAYLFTLRLQRPTSEPLYQMQIGALAMSPGAKFSLTTSTQTLTLSGKLAAAWFEQIAVGSVDSGAMVFQGPMSFPVSGGEFLAVPTTIKRGNETNPALPAPQRVASVTFDTVGNLYMLDAFTERLNVYNPALTHLFTFGTPSPDGRTAEFHEPWGMAFWPDATGTGGRIFINDTYKSRIMVYRPFVGPGGGTEFSGLQLETVIKGFVAQSPAYYGNAIALDPPSGRIAVTDYAEDEVWNPRTIVLQQPDLATFDLQVLDASGGVLQNLCTGSDYKIRFSLTVPAGRGPVRGVVPQLSVGGAPTAAPAVPADNYPSSTLRSGQVVTYTYSLTANGTADIAVLAGATSTNTTDILQRAGSISVADCAAETDPSTITAAPSAPAQVSGWTPVFTGELFQVTLTSQDNDGIRSIEYQLDGANDTGEQPVLVDFAGKPTDAVFIVPLPEFGRSTLNYRVRDGRGIWSPMQVFNVRTKLVVDQSTTESAPVQFRVGDPEGVGYTFSVTGLPAGMTFSTTTGQIAGLMSFDANNPYSADPAVKTGTYHVVVTETKGSATSNVAFTWTVYNVNRHPTITPIAPSDMPPITEGELFEMPVHGFDPDGDKAFFTLIGRGSPLGYDLPASVVIDAATGKISGTFPPNSEASYTLNIGLAECAGGPNDHPVICVGVLPRTGLATTTTITVTVKNINQPPVVNNPGPQTNAQGDVITPLKIVASDPDVPTGDVLTYAGIGLPPGLTINTATGLISGTVNFAAPAVTYPVVVTVRDQAGVVPLPAVQFNWTITQNRPPVVTNPGAQTSLESVTIALPIVATDPDHQPLTYSASGLPPGLSINSLGVVVGTLPFNAAGTYTVTVFASDGSLSASTTFTWKVTDVPRAPVCTAAAPTPGQLWPPNHKPVYVAVGGITYPDGGTATTRFTSILQDEPTNSEGDGNTTQDAGIDADGKVWVRAERSGLFDGRVYILGFTATDNNGASCSGTVLVGVPHDQGQGNVVIPSAGRWNSITGALMVAPPPDAGDDSLSTKKGVAAVVAVQSNDVVYGPVTLSIASAPGSGTATVNSNGTVTYTPAANWTGSTSFTYRLTNGAGSDTAVVSVTVKK